MSDDIGALVARVVADTEQFRSEMVRTARQLESNTARMNKALANVSRSTGALSAGFATVTRGLGALGIAFSVRSIVGFVDRTIKAGAELKNLSERLNISVESLSELQYVAKLSDVSFDTMTTSLQFMTRTLGEANRGGKAARDTFAELGVDFKVLANLSVSEQFDTISAALHRVDDESARVSLAQKTLGRSGIELLQIINKGAGEMAGMKKEARDLGLVISTETATAFDRYDDQLTQYGERWSAFWRGQIVDVGNWYDFQLLKITAIGNLMKDQPPTLPQPVQAEDLVGLALGNPQLRALGQGLSGKGSPPPAGLLPKPAVLPELSEISTSGIPSLMGSGTGGAHEQMKEAELDLTNFIKEQQAQRLATALEMQTLEREARLSIDEERATHDTDMGAVLTEQLRRQMDERLAIEDELTRATQEHDIIRLESAKAAAEMGLDATRAALEQELMWRGLVANSAIGLLQQVGQKHRGAAIAALAIQKVLAVKEIVIQAQVAAMRAMAELGPIAGPPVAAGIAAMAGVSVALVGATAVLEAHQLASQGTQATLGTRVNPISTTSSASSNGAAQAIASHRRDVTEVHLHGDVYGWDEFMQRKFADGMRDLFDRDVVIIRSDTAQAAELAFAGP